ncbi:MULTISPECIES: hypothetical protein [unclassified Burkholderia]|uniref:hypothetical protein n=1 Tax=unclassified Burkholderia TaxID=2613784 RepID=UPI0015C641ED|nr:MULTISPECIES: hypothetical protein [unclassified Burkholderia]MDN7429912.1 hypothetical protein [Burkholderia sp. AU45388]
MSDVVDSVVSSPPFEAQGFTISIASVIVQRACLAFAGRFVTSGHHRSLEFVALQEVGRFFYSGMFR